MRNMNNLVNKMKRIIIFVLLVMVFTGSPMFLFQLFSQPIPPPVTAPIDGGLGVIAFLGIGFLLRRKFIRNK